MNVQIHRKRKKEFKAEYVERKISFDFLAVKILMVLK